MAAILRVDPGCGTMNDQTITARAPGKIILFGEHAINRGQPALAAAAGLYTTCTAKRAPAFILRSGANNQSASRDEILELGARVDKYRAAQAYDEVRALKRDDYFAPQKYVLASALPEPLELEWQSDLPSASGLGSGGAAFTSMVASIAPFLPKPPTLVQRIDWAHRGDIVAHGGIASALDVSTSSLGGVIRYSGQGLADQVRCAPGMAIVIGHTGVAAATSDVNTRVRLWLAEEPARIAHFQSIGALSRAAEPLLARGDWGELGRLLNLNQLVLEKIGVSCAESDRLIQAAIRAGALGAKISGSGGGGIIIALTSPDQKQAVADAIQSAGGQVLTPEIGVSGVL